MDNNERKDREKLLEAFNERARRKGLKAVTSTRYSEEQLERGSTQYIEVLLRFIGSDLDGKDVLEVGCGTGRITEILLPRARNVTVVEISPDMIRQNREHLGIEANKVTYFHGYMQDYIAKKPHDVALCSHVLLHQSDLLLKPFISSLANAAQTVFEIGMTDPTITVSQDTWVRTEEQVITAFAPFFSLLRNDNYLYFEDPISFLKFGRRN